MRLHKTTAMKIRQNKFHQLVAITTSALCCLAIFISLTAVFISQNSQTAHAADATVNSYVDLTNAINNTCTTSTPCTIAISTGFPITAQIIIPANKNITLTSDTTTQTLIRGTTFNGFLFSVPNAGSSLTLTNITIDGGSRNDGTITGSLINSIQTTTIGSGATLQNNYKVNAGGAIQANGGTLNITDGALITRNTATTYAAGISVAGATLNITGGTISNNTAGTYGGGISVSSGTLNFSGDFQIINNIAGTSGGGINSAVSFKLPSGTISGNRAGTNGGGIYTGSNTALNLYGATLSDPTTVVISNNHAGTKANGSGGGIATATASSVTINGATITDNDTAISLDAGATTTSGNGGGIFLNGSAASPSSISVTNATITGNLARQSGGGIYGNTSGAVAVSGATNRSNNHAAVLANGNGGGLSVNSGTDPSHSTVTIKDTVQIKNNTVGTQAGDTGTGNGGGVQVGGYTDATVSDDVAISGNSATGNGGGIYVPANSALIIQNSASISYNTANAGGGVYAGGTATKVNMTGGTISYNTANTGGGGGLSFMNAMGANSISGGSFIGNRALASSGGGIYQNGGSVLVSGTTLIRGKVSGARAGGYYVYSASAADVQFIDKVEISKNSSPAGGGIQVNSHAVMTASDEVKIIDNWTFSIPDVNSGDGGGIYLVLGGSATLNDDVVVSGNTADKNGGGIWVDYNHLDKLNVATDVVFSDNSAGSLHYILPRDQALYDAHIFATTWTTPLTNGYNNYDISYTDTVVVSFDSAGGSSVPSERVFVAEPITEPTAPTRAGYVFAGWWNGNAQWNFGDEQGNGADLIYTDLTLTAHWDKIPDAPNTGGSGLTKFLQENKGVTTVVLLLIVFVSLGGAVLVGRKLIRKTL